MHVQVCTLDRCCEHQLTHLIHARYRMCICAVYIHVYMYICMYIYIVCMNIYIYVGVYIHSEVKIAFIIARKEIM